MWNVSGQILNVPSIFLVDADLKGLDNKTVDFAVLPI